LNIKKPLILVTADYDYNKDASQIKNLYCEALAEAGAAPLLVPISEREDLFHTYIESSDGIMITGGPDIDPFYYGESTLPCNGEVSPYRDFMELKLIKKAFQSKKPMLGICRGIQCINIALGGTIYQDIHEQLKDKQLIKHSQNAPRWHVTHEVSIKKGSFLHQVCKSEKTYVNSFHHQAVKDIAPDFQATSWAEDGIIESIEYSKDCFIVGVQWHPEDLWKKHAAQKELFVEFVENCRR
jgi:putative glutamine amidotransferase